MNTTGQFLSMVSLSKKVAAPLLPLKFVHRAAALQRLNELILGTTPTSAHYKLLLLKAPAGYGKTTLLAEFDQQQLIPCCWFFLDQSDAEPCTFVRTLLASIQQCFPAFGAQLLSLFAQASSDAHASPRQCLEALMEALDHELPQRFVLFLCDYQKVNAHPEITALLAYLLDHLPEQGMLVLESREIPDLDFASLLAKHAMVGLGRECLRFSPQEIHTLASIQERQGLSIDEAEHLAATFDGWITGLLLGTWLGDVHFLQRAWGASLLCPGGGGHIRTALLSYMIQEVFQYHARAYAFLKEASVIEEMTPSFCSDLLEMTQSKALECLQDLEQHGLFVTCHRKGGQSIYTCSPFLRELLSEELQQCNPERFRQLHRRAAELWSRSQRYQSAIYHALEAKMDDFAIQLISSSAECMLEQGDQEILQQWVEVFSEATIACCPRLMLIQAALFLRKSELHLALPLLEKIAACLKLPPQGFFTSEERSLFRAKFDLLRAQTLLQQGKYLQTQSLCQHILADLPAAETTLHAWVHLAFGASAQCLGDFATKITHYQKALQLWGRNTVSCLTADAHSSLAEAYGMLGHFVLAEHHGARALACWQQLQHTPGIVKHLIIQATLKADQGRFDEAESLLQQALAPDKSLGHWPVVQGYTLVNLSVFYQDYGLYDRLLAPAEEGLALARQLGDVYLLNEAIMMLTLTYLYMGDTSTAHLLLAEMPQEDSSKTPVRAYQQVQRDLVQGTIWLQQHCYAQACALLKTVEAELSIIGVKRDQIKALVRLSACYIGQQQPAQACEHLAVVERLLAAFPGYEQRVRVEIGMYPSLRLLIKQQAEDSALHVLLHCKET